MITLIEQKQVAFTSKQFFTALVFSFIAFSFISVPEVWAQSATENPLSGVKFGGSTVDGDADMADVFGFFIKLFVTALPFLILVWVFADSLMAIGQGLKTARKDGDWAGFFSTMLMVLLGISVTLVVGYFLFEVLGKFEGFWDKLST